MKFCDFYILVLYKNVVSKGLISCLVKGTMYKMKFPDLKLAPFLIEKHPFTVILSKII